MDTDRACFKAREVVSEEPKDEKEEEGGEDGRDVGHESGVGAGGSKFGGEYEHAVVVAKNIKTVIIMYPYTVCRYLYFSLLKYATKQETEAKRKKYPVQRTRPK